jgi:hypothetical protein
MTQNLPYAYHDISGGITVKLRDDLSLDDICMENLPDYNRDRFEAVALRLFAGKEVIVTIYAIDKERQEGSNFNPDKMPVKKFKIENVSVPKLFEWFQEFNFTINTGNYHIEDMEVINK